MTRNPMQEAADELGCDTDELTGTFPASFLRLAGLVPAADPFDDEDA